MDSEVVENGKKVSFGCGLRQSRSFRIANAAQSLAEHASLVTIISLRLQFILNYDTFQYVHEATVMMRFVLSKTLALIALAPEIPFPPSAIRPN
uniref:Uncharacterized protein n=1 Tax=Syphacia muris TaxID=451379 RepID=A0A0N5ARM4_9BILA